MRDYLQALVDADLELAKYLGPKHAARQALLVLASKYTTTIPEFVICVECLEETKEWITGYTSQAPYCISCARKLRILDDKFSITPLDTDSSR